MHACVYSRPGRAGSADLPWLGLGRESGLWQAGALAEWPPGILQGPCASRRNEGAASLRALQTCKEVTTASKTQSEITCMLALLCIGF